MEEMHRDNICQCMTCGRVFSFSQKKLDKIHVYGACPYCGHEYTIIQFANERDEIYVNSLADKLSY